MQTLYGSNDLPKYGISQQNTAIQEIAGRLLAIRETRRMTQQEFADRLGFPKRTYLAWERGDSEPPLRLLAAVVREFGVDANWLLEGPSSVPISKGATLDWDRAIRIYEELVEELGRMNVILEPRQLLRYIKIIFSEDPSVEKMVKSTIIETLLTGVEK